MSYTTPEDFKKFTLIPPLKLLDDAIIQSKIDIAEMKIESYCNQQFNSDSGKIICLDGDGSSQLVLNQRIYKINSLFFDERDYTTNSVIDSDSNNFTIKMKPDPYLEALYREVPIRDLIPKFTEGVSNIILNGDFGWETIPKEVVYCTLKLTEAYCLLVGNMEVLMNESGIYKKQTIGGYSWELKSDNKESTGDTTCDTLLLKYRRVIKKNRMKVSVI